MNEDELLELNYKKPTKLKLFDIEIGSQVATMWAGKIEIGVITRAYKEYAGAEIKIGEFYKLESTCPYVAEIKSIFNDTVYYRAFNMNGKLISKHVVRSLTLFKSRQKSRVKPKNPTEK